MKGSSITRRVLVVNHGPTEIRAEITQSRSGLAAVFAPDNVVRVEVVRAHEELSCLLTDNQYVVLRAV